MPFDKPRTPRAAGGKSFGPRTGSSSGPRKPYGEKSGDRPAYGEKRPYTPRAPREGNNEDRPKRAYGDKPAYSPRPYAPRAEGGAERPKRAYGDKPAYGEKRPYTPRATGGEDRPRRAYGDKPAYSPRPYTPREGGEDRPRRAYGDKPAYSPRPQYTPRSPRTEGSEDRPARVQEWGDAKKPRYAAKPNHRAQFERKADAGLPLLANGDGWLVGHHAVLAALNNGRRKVREIWLLAEATGELATVLAAHPEWPVSIKAREDFNREFAEAVHQGVAALVGNLQQPSLPELLAQKPQVLVALDQVTDPHNLGAIVRSCAAFGAKGVLVTEHRAAGVNATAAKAAAGALETVPVADVTNLAQALKMLDEAGYAIVGLAGEAEAELGQILATIPATQPVCLVVGSEGEGLRRLTRENCQHICKIAISSAVESLNVSVATGVALSMIVRR